MLKTKSQWEELPPNERLILLSLAHQLRSIKGLRVPFEEARAISGFSKDDFASILDQLYMRGLITKNNQGVTLIGDAFNEHLVGDKRDEVTKHEGQLELTKSVSR
jgi:hypothetical protein